MGKHRPEKNGRIFGGWKKGKTYIAPLYIGYTDKGVVNRIGYSNRYFQDYTQNYVHQRVFLGRQHFYSDYTDLYTGIYSYSGLSNKFSILGR